MRLSGKMMLMRSQSQNQNNSGQMQGNMNAQGYGNMGMNQGYGNMESNQMQMGYGGMNGGQMQGNQMRNGMEMQNGSNMRGDPGYERDRRGRFSGETGYGMESRGQRRNEDGRFTSRNEMRSEGPRSGGERIYDIDVNRYEYENEPEGNYRSEMRGGGNSGRRGDQARDARNEQEGGNMRMIGFGRELYNDMRSDASMPSYREGDHMTGGKHQKGGTKSNMGMDENMAKEWTEKMQNEDGTRGPHWSVEQIKKVMEQRNMPGDPVEFWVAMNMMYSDYCKVAKKLGVNTVDFYADMAKAFIEDKDVKVPDKLTAYYEYIVKGS